MGGGRGEEEEEEGGEGVKSYILIIHTPDEQVTSSLQYPHTLTWMKSFLLTRVGSAMRS